MKPSYERILDGGAVKWREQYRDVGIELSFHQYAPHFHMEGTWCYYLLLDEQMFFAGDFAELMCERDKNEYGRFYRYHEFPDLDFHGGVTFYDISQYWSKHENKDFQMIKVGCDYAHLWDQEAGYPDTYDTVLLDAKHSVDRLFELYKFTKARCAYSHKWDVPTNFYIAKNGKTVHKSMIDQLVENGWDGWLPKGEE